MNFLTSVTIAGIVVVILYGLTDAPGWAIAAVAILAYLIAANGVHASG